MLIIFQIKKCKTYINMLFYKTGKEQAGSSVLTFLSHLYCHFTTHGLIEGPYKNQVFKK